MKQYSVLIIDSDRSWCMELIEALLDYPCFTIVPPLYNGKEGLDYVVQFHPDIIILDLLLPDYDGMYIINQARNLAHYRPFIYVLSSLGPEQTDSTLKKVDVDYYGIRPFCPKALVQNLHWWLENPILKPRS